jgi:hypothetical protein
MGLELNFTRFQVAFVNAEDRLLTFFRQIEDTRATIAIIALAFDGDRRENFRLFAFWEMMALHRHDHSVASLVGDPLQIHRWWTPTKAPTFRGTKPGGF